MCLTAQKKIRIRIKNKTAGHAGIACFSFALKGNRAGSPHFKIVRFKWWEHVTIKLTAEDITYLEEPYVPHKIIGAIDKNPKQGVVLLDEKK